MVNKRLIEIYEEDYFKILSIKTKRDINGDKVTFADIVAERFKGDKV